MTFPLINLVKTKNRTVRQNYSLVKNLTEVQSKVKSESFNQGLNIGLDLPTG